MQYRAYIDDSADGKRERVVIAGAIIGSQQVWTNFSRRWLSKLGESEIEYFKSSHCESLNGQFHKFRTLGLEEGKRKAGRIRDDLDLIVRTTPLTGLGITLSVPFHQVMLADRQKFGEIPEVPYRLAFQQVIAECAKAMQLLGRGNVVSFGHDDGDDFQILHTLYNEFKKRNPRYSGILGEFVPGDDKVHPPVQAADLAAYVTLKFANSYMDNPTGENMKRLRGSMYKIVNWLENAQPYGNMNTEDAPAKAIYVM